MLISSLGTPETLHVSYLEMPSTCKLSLWLLPAKMYGFIDKGETVLIVILASLKLGENNNQHIPPFVDQMPKFGMTYRDQ